MKIRPNIEKIKARFPPGAIIDSSALLIVVVIVFWKLALTNLIIARGDVFTYFYPYLDYAAEATREGRLPLWNPYLFMGVPFLANSQVGFFYPFNRLLSWLPVTRAVNVTILLHAWIAGLGVYTFARRSLNLSRLAGWTAGAAFAVGGYLVAQVEHINQLQGLAWLPWLFMWFDEGNHLQADRSSRLEQAIQAEGRLPLAWIGLAVTIALQLLTGHTQTAFISLFGLGVYALVKNLAQPRRTSVLRWAALAGAVLAGAGLAAVQLLPTFELAQLSMRSGGLSWREAVSFSLKPMLLGRALLPHYQQAIFPEYVAYVGVTGLALIAIGLISRWRDRRIRAVLVVSGLGLFFALGGYNPLYLLLARFAPGFGLFRVPARWLALYAWGAALLIGAGLDNVSSANKKTLVLWGLTLSGLVALAFCAARTNVPGAAQPAGAVSPLTWTGWLVTACAIAILIWAHPRRATAALAAILLIELFFASADLPFNRATAPQALTSLRPSILNLLIDDHRPPTHQLTNFRLLSLSDIFFDPGDKAELSSAFADRLSADALYDLLVATKQKEILAPNLPLYYRLASADGFDGGVLPLRDYVMFQQLFVPPERISPDGRLREALRDVPDSKWLALMNVRYIITDKTLDAWIDDVFYDLQFSTALGSAGAPRATVARVPRFAATALGLVSYLQGASHLPQGSPVAQAMIGFDDGTVQTFILRAGVDTAEGIYTGKVAHQPAQAGGHFVRDHPEVNDYVTRLRWDTAHVVTSVEVQPLIESGQIILRGASLIDERTGGFQSLVISGRGRFALIHSGDVKIYENLDVLPRAFVVTASRVAHGEEALSAMRKLCLECEVILSPDTRSDEPGLQTAGGGTGTARLVLYRPEHVVVDVDAPGLDNWLVLTDSYYPGWRALVDGQPTPVVRADVLFRAVHVPAGTHRVEFIYDPLSLKIGAVISALAWLLVISQSIRSFMSLRLSSISDRARSGDRP